MKLLKQRSADSIHVVMGGIIPKADIPYLKRIGIKGVFGPNTDTREVVSFICELVSKKRIPEDSHVK